MKLSQIIEQLQGSELSQLSIASQPRGEINENNIKQVINLINLGLTDLHSRFMLREGRLAVSLKPDMTVYPLDSKYAVANRRSNEPFRFILDNANAPFVDDLMRVERIYTDQRFELALNVHTDPWAILTPTMKTLVVPAAMAKPTPSTPDWYKTNRLEVVYRANHPPINAGFGFFDPARVEVHLPDTHLTALLYYIGSRVHNPVGMVNEFNAGNNYAAKYEAECTRLKFAGLEVGQVGVEDRISSKGFR